MGTRESSAWQTVRDTFDSDLLLKRITEKLNPGTPDILWKHRQLVCAGWIELKADGEHWVTPEQALWLREWRTTPGGLAGVLQRCDGLWTYYPAEPTHQWVKLILNEPSSCPQEIQKRLRDLLPAIVTGMLL